MHIDDARLGMYKIRNLRKELMDTYGYFSEIGDIYDSINPEYKLITEAIYECVLSLDAASETINRFSVTKAHT